MRHYISALCIQRAVQSVLFYDVLEVAVVATRQAQKVRGMQFLA